VRIVLDTTRPGSPAHAKEGSGYTVARSGAVSETKTKSDRVKKRGKKVAKKAKRRLHGPTAKEAIEALHESQRRAAEIGTDKITDEEIEAEVQAYRQGR
jgi:hypothetical protein